MRRRCGAGRVANQCEYQVTLVWRLAAAQAHAHVGVEIARPRDQRIIRGTLVCRLYRDTPDTGTGQIRERACGVLRCGHDRDARREQSLLSVSTDTGNDYLPAVALDLVVCEYHLQRGEAGPAGKSGPRVRARSFDHVFLDRLDRDAALAQPRECPLDLLARALELDRDQPHLFRDAGPADVEYQVEFLDQVVEQRLADERFGIGQVIAFAEAFHLP